MADQFVPVGKNEFNVPIDALGNTELMFNDIQAVASYHDDLVTAAAKRMTAELGLDWDKLSEHSEASDRTNSQTFWWNLAEIVLTTPVEELKEGSTSDLRAYLKSVQKTLAARENENISRFHFDIEKIIDRTLHWDTQKENQAKCTHPSNMMRYTGTARGGSNKGDDHYECKCGYGEYR